MNTVVYQPLCKSCVVIVVLACFFNQSESQGQTTEPRSSNASRRADVATGLGLDIIQRRAINDSWILSHQSTYENTGPSKLALRLAIALEKSPKLREPGQVEVPVDTDEDGLVDMWVFFDRDKPAFVEADRFKTGCRDFRFELGAADKRAAKTHKRWFQTPPVPLPPTKNRDVSMFDFYRFAFDQKPDDQVNLPLTKLAIELFPNIQKETRALLGQNRPRGIEGEIKTYVDNAIRLLPKFQQVWQDEEFAKKLFIYQGHQVLTRGYDRDGKEGEEVAVAYSPWGVDSIQFHEHDWRDGLKSDDGPLLKSTGLIAEIFFQNDGIARVDYKGQRYFPIGGIWFCLSPQARRMIAIDFLLPAYRKYRSGKWYAAMAQWRRASKLVALTGDIRVNANARLYGSVDKFSDHNWQFPVRGPLAVELLQVGHAFAYGNEFPAFLDLARDSASKAEFQEALQLHQLTIRFANKASKMLRKALALEEMSVVYKQIGNYGRAIECLFESLDLEASLSYSRDVIENLKVLSQDPTDEAAFARTMEMRRHAMAANRACKVASIAALYADLGETVKAKNYLAEAQRVAGNLGHRYVEADLLNLQAKLDLAEGRWEIGVQRLERALEVAQRQYADQLTSDEARPAGEKGSRAVHVFNVAEHQQVFLKVAMISRTHPLSYQALSASLLTEAHLQRSVSHPASANESLQTARAWQTQAAEWFREANDAKGMLASKLRQATIAAQEGKFAEALPLTEEVLADSRAQHVLETEWRALALRGSIYKKRGRLDDAIDAYEAAATEIESLRARIHSEPARRGFFASKIDVYEQLALLYLQARDGGKTRVDDLDTKIWQCMERAKARTLLDMIGGQNLNIKGAEVAQTRQRVPGLFSGIRQGAADVNPVDAEQLREALADWPLLKEVASLSSVAPVTFQDLSAELKDGDVVIEYFVTHSDLLAAVITKDRLQVVKIPGLSRERLRNEVDRFRKLLVKPTRDYEAPAKDLYERLLLPCLLAAKVKPKRLCIVPAEMLHYLPFAALRTTGGQFLAEATYVSHAPSASALVYSIHRSRAQKRDPAARSTLIVANPKPQLGFPDLPHAAKEGEYITKVSQRPTLLDGPAATESAIKAHLPKTHYFHFAGHTHFPESSPLRAALMCTEEIYEDGRLEVREIFEMNLQNCRMAVLSACETHLGRWSRGDEIVGIERAFLRAGVPTVVASLWKVDDAATQALMEDFYRNLWAEDAPSRVAALHQAQRKMIDGTLQPTVNRYSRALGKPAPLPVGDAPAPGPKEKVFTRHPRFWAAFVLSGAWD